MTTLAPSTTELLVLESPEERRRRHRLSWILLALATIGIVLAFATPTGNITFGLGDGGGSGPSVPAKPLALVLAGYLLVVGVLQLTKGLRGPTAGTLFGIFGVAFVVTFLCWAVAGRDAFQVTNQLQGTLNFATPLILGALAGVICERAGVINIAIEGQFLVGAFAASLVASITQNLWFGSIAAMAAGVLLALLLAVFSIRYLVNQVILGVVLVVFATGITGFLLDAFVKNDSALYNSPPVMSRLAIPGLSSIPVLGPTLFNQTALVYAMYIAVAVMTFVLFRTRWGLRVRAVGEHPRAADTVGIKVLRIRYQAVLLGGVIAGFGGAFFTIGSTGSFDKELTAGNGFIALAAVIMGRWHPIGGTLAALFFGFTLQLGTQLQSLGTPVPSNLLSMTPYLLTILAVAGLVGKVQAPKADGEPYTKE